MSSAALELQKALYGTLKLHAPLTTLLGGPHIYDDVPQRAALPYVTFGQSLMRDWSTGTELGHEHVVTLHIWSRAAGRKEVHQIMDVIEQLLRDQAPALADHRLVNLRYEYSDARRDPDGELYHGVVRYRVVTEPLV